MLFSDPFTQHQRPVSEPAITYVPAVDITRPMPGHHRGMLAGLTGTARADALEQSVATARSEIELSDLLGGLAAKGPRATSLFDCLMTWKKDRLAGCARGLQIKGVASKKKAVIAEAITERVASTPELPRAMLALLTSAGIEAAATLYREGGAIALDKGNRSDYLPLCFSIYAFPFNEDGRFVAVMPDEIRKLFDDTDFDTAMELRATYEKITRLADSAVSMRGVTTTRELYAEFDKRWPQTCTQTEFVTVLNLLQSEQTGPFDIFFSAERNTSVLVDRSLSYEALVSVEDPDADLDDVLLADRNIAYLLEQHEKRAAAPVPDALIEEGDYLYWAYTIPAVDALREFLDEQVPDGCDDYLFTDDAMMTLLDMAHGGYQLDRYFEVLAEMGFEPEQGYLQHISNLLINMLSVSPRWDDNGWSFLEIEGLGTPSKTFLNENGTVVKVGRNDPCPCGSGKKYKKCHGR